MAESTPNEYLKKNKTRDAISKSKLSSHHSLPEKCNGPEKNVIVKGGQYSSLQHMEYEEQRKLTGNLRGKKYLMSSGSEEMLVLPPGTVSYYSTESEDHEDMINPHKRFGTSSQDDLKIPVSIAEDMRDTFERLCMQKRSEIGVVPTDTKSGDKNCLDVQSMGSGSENTDSVKTVMDNLCTQMNEEVTASDQQPSFIVGGEMSPRTMTMQEKQNYIKNRMSEYKLTLDISSNPTSMEYYDDMKQFQPPASNTSEQEISLTSQIPESSDRGGTSPSVMSVSSLNSSRRLEWDSAADIGYSGANMHASSTSLSTLERMTLSKCASNILGLDSSKYLSIDDRHKKTKSSKCKLEGKSYSHSDVPNIKRFAPLTESTTPNRLTKVKPPHFPLGSSSDEDLSKVSSSSQSPRRKLRKRSTVLTDKKENPCVSQSRWHNTAKHVDDMKFISLGELNQSAARPLIMKRSYGPSMSKGSERALSPNATSVGSSSTVLYSAKSSMMTSIEDDNFSDRLKSPDETLRPPKSSINSPNEVDTGPICDLSTTVHELTQYPILSPSLEEATACSEDKVILNQMLPGDDAGSQISFEQMAQMATSDTIQTSTPDPNKVSVPTSDDSQSVNNFLFELSSKLRKHLESLVEKQVGTHAKSSQQYAKLMEYIDFIGIESSPDKLKLRQNIAEHIVDMCGQVLTKYEQQQPSTGKYKC